MPLTDINALLTEVAAPLPPPLTNLAQVRIADIAGFTEDQVLEALHLFAQEGPGISPDRNGKMTPRQYPARYLTYGALLTRAGAYDRRKRWWGSRDAFLFLLQEVKSFDWRCYLQFAVAYQHVSDLGFTPEEMEDLERRPGSWKRLQACAKYAANKSHFTLAFNTRGRVRTILYAGPRGGVHTGLALAKLYFSRKEYIVVNHLIQWFQGEFQANPRETVIAMALIVQTWLEKSPLERRRFLRAQCKELGLNPEIAERFF